MGRAFAAQHLTGMYFGAGRLLRLEYTPEDRHPSEHLLELKCIIQPTGDAFSTLTHKRKGAGYGHRANWREPKAEYKGPDGVAFARACR